MTYLLTRNPKREFSARIPLPRRQVIIGRAPKAAIQIDDRSVSKIHASLEPLAKKQPDDPDRYLLRDLGSSNGIIFKGSMHKELVVRIGDEFRLGQVFVTLCGEGPETLEAPEVAEPAAAFVGDGAVGEPPPKDSLWRGMLDRSERNLVVAIAVVGVAIAVALFVFPPWGSDDSGDAEPAPNGGAVAAVDVSGDGNDDAPQVEDVVDPREEARAEAERIVQRRRESWAALGRDLDAGCSTAGCHSTCAEIDFHVSVDDELGRWERNLLILRSKSTLSVDGETLTMKPFAQTGPHAAEVTVSISPEARSGVAALYENRGRLLAADAVAGSVEDVAALPYADVAQLRHIWLLLYGRAPTAAELVANCGRDPAALLEEARERPEFWDERVRRALRGRPRMPADGGFALPGSVAPGEVPFDPADWAKSVRRACERAGEATDHLYGKPAPLPADDGSDLAHRGWFLQKVVEPARAVPPDAYLRSVWSMLWGEPIDRFEEEVLRKSLASGVDWTALRPRVVTLLVNAPRCPFPWPNPEAESADLERWVDGFAKLVLGRELTPAVKSELANQIAAEAIDTRALVEEALLATLQRKSRETKKNPEVPADEDPEGIRIEVVCGFPVRPILHPDKIPELWRRFERSVVQTFVEDDTARDVICARARKGAIDDGTLIISHTGWLPDSRFTERVRVADGLLLTSLRRMADRYGEPRVAPVAEHVRPRLRQLLGIAAPPLPADGTAAALELFRAGGYRLLPGEWESGVFRPATRTLLLAQAQLAADAIAGRNDALNVWVPLQSAPDGSDRRHWEEFMNGLELLVLEHPRRPFDLWFWGVRADGSGADAIRVQWGPAIERGVVRHESDVGRRFHPMLRDFDPPGTGSESDDEKRDG